MSKRNEITRELSRMVERKLANETPYWVSECNLNIRENNSARVDYVAFTPSWGKGSEVSAAELGRFDFYEVKSCMEDFKSGHGLNFEGDTNILVCERELADELCRRRMFPKNCDKVLCPNKSRSALIAVYTPNPGGLQSNRRCYPASHLLLCMMSRMAPYRAEHTCRMIDNGVELCCSECDCRHSYDDEPKFCMGCGARVV